jgi:hypothetical protein
MLDQIGESDNPQDFLRPVLMLKRHAPRCPRNFP